jgi:hypothetical protein
MVFQLFCHVVHKLYLVLMLHPWPGTDRQTDATRNITVYTHKCTVPPPLPPHLFWSNSQTRLILEVSISHTMSHRSRYDSSGRGIGLRKDLYLTRDNHAPSGIRIRNSNTRTAADPRLWPLRHGHLYRCPKILRLWILFEIMQTSEVSVSVFAPANKKLHRMTWAHNKERYKKGCSRFYSTLLFVSPAWQLGRVVTSHLVIAIQFRIVLFVCLFVWNSSQYTVLQTVYPVTQYTDHTKAFFASKTSYASTVGVSK